MEATRSVMGACDYAAAQLNILGYGIMRVDPVIYSFYDDKQGSDDAHWGITIDDAKHGRVWEARYVATDVAHINTYVQDAIAAWKRFIAVT